MKNIDRKSNNIVGNTFERTHGLSNHPLYRRYYDIINRCYRVSHISYHKYGGRGIIVCEEWKNSFINFYNWAISNGWKQDLCIDRINNDGNYEPLNCRWISTKENSRNTRQNVNIEYDGKIKCIAEWAEYFDISARVLRQRMIRDKMSFEEAVSRPIRIDRRNKNKYLTKLITHA